jgi:hypothetical protein
VDSSVALALPLRQKARHDIEPRQALCRRVDDRRSCGLAAELLDGGSIYWVIRGIIMVRQKLVGFEEGTREDGSACCTLMLDRTLVPVRPTPRRAFQGWRYLDASDAPPDLRKGKKDQIAAMPAEMRKKLADLGLI